MKQTLYLGLELPPHLQDHNVTHCPFIRIIPKPATDPDIVLAFKSIPNYTHIIFTSRSAVSIFFDLLNTYSISPKQLAAKSIVAVGQRTAQKLNEYNVHVNHIATEETAEGITQTLASLPMEDAHVFLPQSAISRTVINDWLKQHAINYTATPIYTTVSNLPSPLPDLSVFNEIIFTSPSTVEAFIKGYGTLPEGIKLTCIGPVTERKLFSFKNS